MDFMWLEWRKMIWMGEGMGQWCVTDKVELRIDETKQVKEELSHDMTKPTKWLRAQQRLRSAWASAQSDQSLRCALNG